MCPCAGTDGSGKENTVEKEPQVRCDACHQFKTHAFVKFKFVILCLDCLRSIDIIATKVGLAGFYENVRKYQSGVIAEVPKEDPSE